MIHTTAGDVARSIEVAIEAVDDAEGDAKELSAFGHGNELMAELSRRLATVRSILDGMRDAVRDAESVRTNREEKWARRG